MRGWGRLRIDVKTKKWLGQVECDSRTYVCERESLRWLVWVRRCEHVCVGGPEMHRKTFREAHVSLETIPEPLLPALTWRGNML